MNCEPKGDALVVLFARERLGCKPPAHAYGVWKTSVEFGQQESPLTWPSRGSHRIQRMAAPVSLPFSAPRRPAPLPAAPTYKRCQAPRQASPTPFPGYHSPHGTHTPPQLPRAHDRRPELRHPSGLQVHRRLAPQRRDAGPSSMPTPSPRRAQPLLLGRPEQHPVQLLEDTRRRTGLAAHYVGEMSGTDSRPPGYLVLTDPMSIHTAPECLLVSAGSLRKSDRRLGLQDCLDTRLDLDSHPPAAP